MVMDAFQMDMKPGWEMWSVTFSVTATPKSPSPTGTSLWPVHLPQTVCVQAKFIPLEQEMFVEGLRKVVSVA